MPTPAPKVSPATDRPIGAIGQAAGPGLCALVLLGIFRLNRTSLWWDETYTLASSNSLTTTMSISKASMVLYYLGIWPWARFGESAWWLRSFSLVGAAVTIVLLADIARRFAPSSDARRLAWVAPLLLVGIPIFAWTAVEARAYAWENAAVTACWWLILAGAPDTPDRGSDYRRRRSALTILCAIGPLLHGLFILQMIGMACTVLVGRGDRRRLWRLLRPAIAASCFVTIVVYFAGGAAMGARWSDSMLADATLLRAWFLSPNRVVAAMVGFLFLGGVPLGVRRLSAVVPASQRIRVVLPLLWAVPPLVGGLAIASTGRPFAPYYMAPSAAGIALGVSDALGLIIAAGRRRGRTATLSAGALVIAVLAFVGAVSVRHPLAYEQDWRGAARLVATEARPGDAIMFTGDPEMTHVSRAAFSGFAAAWHEIPHAHSPRVLSHHRQLDDPIVRRIPAVGPAAVERAWLESCRIWVVDLGDSESPHVTGAPVVGGSSRPKTSRTFQPDIRVDLYVRNGSSCKPTRDSPTRPVPRRH